MRIFVFHQPVFKKHYIGWPQQPPTEKVLKFNMIFHDSTKITVWTLSQPGGTYYAHHITTGTPRFSDLPTALYRIHNLNTKSIYVLYFVYKVWRLHSWRHKTVVLNFLAAVCLLASPYDSIPLTHFLQVYVYLASHSLYIRGRPETTFLRVGDGRVYLKKYCTVKFGFKELFGHHKKFLKVKSSLFQTFNQSTI